MAGDGSARFPPAMRLKKKTEFIRVFREGEAWKGSRFSLHIRSRTGDEFPRMADHAVLQELGPRLGMVVPRKVGPAVERNRIKRKIREAFRKTAHRLPAVDLVIKPNATCKEAPEEEIMQTLERAVRRVLGNVKERI